MNPLSVILAVGLFLAANAEINCPSVCICDLVSRAVSCRGQGITSVPEDLPRDTVSLDVSENLITELDASSFANYVELKSLDLRRNKVERLENDTFELTQHLEILILNENALPFFESYLPNSLTYLDLSQNKIVRFLSSSALEKLNLSSNSIVDVSAISLSARLKELDLSYNNFTVIGAQAFSPFNELQVLRLNGHPYLHHINVSAFAGLSYLDTLEIRNNPQFPFIHKDLFNHLVNLRTLDLSDNNITSFYAQTFQNLSVLQTLDIHGNPLVCNCALLWLLNTKVNISFVNESLCSEPNHLRNEVLFNIPQENLTCIPPKIVNYTQKAYFRVGAQAVLKCIVTGDPQPLVRWTIPDGRVFLHNNYLEDQWNSNPSKEDVLDEIYHLNGQWQASADEYRTDIGPSRIQLLSNGDLFISYVQRIDAGPYKCEARNPGGNDTIVLTFLLNYQIIKDITVASMIVGFSSAGIFFGFGLIVALVRYITGKCAERQRKRSKSIKKIIGHLDTYRNQQMEKLRDNYGGHVGKMKEHALAQMDKMRENYFSQIARIQDKCASRMDHLRVNYTTQMGKIKGYSNHQIERVRDNYTSQMIKIRDYGSVQLEKLRETYKLQHQHLMKILEAMNIDNCRGFVDGECMRANSVLFDTKFTLDNIDLNLDNINLDDNYGLSKTSSRNSICISEDFQTACSDPDGISLGDISEETHTLAGVHQAPRSPNLHVHREPSELTEMLADHDSQNGVFVIDVDTDTGVNMDACLSVRNSVV